MSTNFITCLKSPEMLATTLLRSHKTEESPSDPCWLQHQVETHLSFSLYLHQLETWITQPKSAYPTTAASLFSTNSTPCTLHLKEFTSPDFTRAWDTHSKSINLYYLQQDTVQFVLLPRKQNDNSLFQKTPINSCSEPMPYTAKPHKGTAEICSFPKNAP